MTGLLRYAQVEPLTTARVLRGPFDYRLGPEFADVAVGSILKVPFGHRPVIGVVTGISGATDVPSEKLVEPTSVLADSVPAVLVELGLWLADDYCSTRARGLALVLPPGIGTGAVAARRPQPKFARFAGLTDPGRDALAGAERLNDRQRGVLQALVERADPTVAVATLAAAAGVDQSAIKRLADRGLIMLTEQRVSRRPVTASIGHVQSGAIELTSDQRRALEVITARIQDRGHHQPPVLINGVTGSGKTEIYLGAAEAALATGRNVIIMVPEIALTPQTVTRFTARFGDQIAVLHSKLSAGERYDEWSRLRSGEARICVGPRSAIFAPLEDVGLIVIDEDHDSSYKQDSDPRYDARSVALRRAELEGAVLVAGTATPRPETWLEFDHVTLPSRVDGRQLPPVELLDMRQVDTALHPQSEIALAAVAHAGQKAIVLLNRRGWSNFLSCRTCGHVWECPNCDVALVLHMAGRTIACHHCGHREPLPGSCTACGSATVARHGSGTEKLEQEMRERLGDASFQIFRLDSDSAGGGADVGALLAAFESASSGVLVGTQMVAKGHDFPDVTLGVVLDADATLRFPDFRAEERTFALVAQLAGRSGRGAAGGRVLVQAMDPGARSLKYAALHDANGFLKGELDRRAAFAYPPYSHLIRIVCASEDPGLAARATESIVGSLRSELPSGVLGPAPLFKLKGRERSQILIKADNRHSAVSAVRGAVEQAGADRQLKGVMLSVDVDPQ